MAVHTTVSHMQVLLFVMSVTGAVTQDVRAKEWTASQLGSRPNLAHNGWNHRYADCPDCSKLKYCNCDSEDHMEAQR